MAYGQVANSAYRDATKTASRLIRNYRAGKMRNRIQKGRVGRPRKWIKKNQHKITYLPSSAFQNPLPRCYHCRFTIEREFLIPANTQIIDSNSLFNLNGLSECLRDNMSGTYTYDFPWFVGSGLHNGIDYINQQPTGLGYLLGNPNTAPYSQYTVISSSFDFCCALGSQADRLCGIVLPVQNNATTTVDASFAMAQPNVRYREFEANKGKQHVSKQQYVHTFLGITKKEGLLDDLSGNYDGSYSGNPGKLIAWKLILKRCNTGNTTDTISGYIRITYNVCLWNQVDGTFYEGPDA